MRGIVAILGAYALVAALSIFKMSNEDIWIHLKTGELIVETGQVPHKDPYSYTAADRDYVAHEWLAAVVFHAVHAAFGVSGLIVFKHLVVLATCLVLCLVCGIRRDAPWLWLAALTLALFIASARFLERPHLFSFFFTALYLLAYFAYREGGRPWALYALPPLHVLWANMHGGHFTGLFLLATLALAEGAAAGRARLWPDEGDRALPPRELAKLAALPFVCALAALVNPYGFRLLTFPFELTRMQVFMRGELGILEWQTPFHPLYNPTAMFACSVAWVALLLATFVLAAVTRARSPRARALPIVGAILAAAFVYELARTYRNAAAPSAIEAHSAAWCVAAALFVLSVARFAPLPDLGIAALFFTLSIRYNRAGADFALATLPVLAHGVGALWRRWPGRPGDAAMLAGTGMLAAALAVLTMAKGYHFSFDPPAVRAGGLGIGDNIPVGAVQYLAKNHVSGRAFGSYDAGGLLIHELWPAVRVGMDSRNDVYGEDLYREYRAALDGPGFPAYAEKWAVDIVVLTNNVPPSPELMQTLEQSREWALVYVDPVSLVCLRRGETFRELIARDEPPLLAPGVTPR